MEGRGGEAAVTNERTVVHEFQEFQGIIHPLNMAFNTYIFVLHEWVTSSIHLESASPLFMQLYVVFPPRFGFFDRSGSLQNSNWLICTVITQHLQLFTENFVQKN